jgi:hypothetical protein
LPVKQSVPSADKNVLSMNIFLYTPQWGYSEIITNT